ncbi:MAG: NAD(+) diphosphatase [Thermomicrobiales bacterium]|nr:NAD(+) diphosphatase [Thermomicrobiales bacterium]
MSLFERIFYPAVVPDESAGSADDAWWFVFRRGEVLITGAMGDDAIPRRATLTRLGLEPARANYLGHLSGEPVYAAELDDEVLAPDGFGFRALRGLYGLVDDQFFALAGRAAQILEWDRSHQFCGRCGTPTEPMPAERAKRCPACGSMSFPRLSPAVIVLVEHGEQVLLARHTRSTDGMYALIAGFVEPGETLEEAVQREIREECGIEVDRIAYFGSQPWPFPHQLMIGFTAQYAGGDVRIDGIEIADAKWFTARAMPKVPPRLSIARKLIDAYAAKHGATIDQP